MWLFIFVFIIIGMLGIICPRTSWYMSNWWKFKGEMEPSDIALVFHRAGGIIFLLISIFLILKY